MGTALAAALPKVITCPDKPRRWFGRHNRGPKKDCAREYSQPKVLHEAFPAILPLIYTRCGGLPQQCFQIVAGPFLRVLCEEDYLLRPNGRKPNDRIQARVTRVLRSCSALRPAGIEDEKGNHQED